MLYFSYTNTKMVLQQWSYIHFFLAPYEQCTSIYRCALFMRAKEKKFILFQLFIKKMPLSLSLIHSHLISLNLTLLTPVSLSTSLSQRCAPAAGSWLCSGLMDQSGFPHLHSAARSWLCSGVRWYRG